MSWGLFRVEWAVRIQTVIDLDNWGCAGSQENHTGILVQFKGPELARRHSGANDKGYAEHGSS